LDKCPFEPRWVRRWDVSLKVGCFGHMLQLSNVAAMANDFLQKEQGEPEKQQLKYDLGDARNQKRRK
jgi:hypothetical protein